MLRNIFSIRTALDLIVRIWRVRQSKTFSGVLITIFGFYTAMFTIALTTYESNLDELEERVAIWSANTAVMPDQGLKTAHRLQAISIPRKPDYLKPLSVFSSLLGDGSVSHATGSVGEIVLLHLNRGVSGEGARLQLGPLVLPDTTFSGTPPEFYRLVSLSYDFDLDGESFEDLIVRNMLYGDYRRLEENEEHDDPEDASAWRVKLDKVGARLFPLSNIEFRDAELSSFRCDYCDLSRVLFLSSDLANSKFIHSDLSRASFKGSILSGSSFEDVDFAFTIFPSDHQFVNLSNVNFEQLILNETNRYSDAPFNFSGSTFADVWMSDLRIGQMRNADFSGSYGIDLDMRSSDLTGTDFSGANLTLSNLTNANMTGVNLKDTDLMFVDLSDVKGLTCESLSLARNWESTTRSADLGCGSPPYDTEYPKVDELVGPATPRVKIDWREASNIDIPEAFRIVQEKLFGQITERFRHGEDVHFIGARFLNLAYTPIFLPEVAGSIKYEVDLAIRGETKRLEIIGYHKAIPLREAPFLLSLMVSAATQFDKRSVEIEKSDLLGVEPEVVIEPRNHARDEIRTLESGFHIVVPDIPHNISVKRGTLINYAQEATMRRLDSHVSRLLTPCRLSDEVRFCRIISFPTYL